MIRERERDRVVHGVLTINNSSKQGSGGITEISHRNTYQITKFRFANELKVKSPVKDSCDFYDISVSCFKN